MLSFRSIRHIWRIVLVTFVSTYTVHAENVLIHLKNGTIQTYSIGQIQKITFNLSGGNNAIQSNMVRVNELRKILAKISPNPFRSSTTVQFTLVKDATVAITVFDIKGQIVKTIINDNLHAGNHSARWNGCRDNNLPVASGTYIARISIDNQIVSSQIMNLVK